MVQIELGGKNALVTGGARGLGRECALILAEAGARVAVADIDLAGAQRTAAEVQGSAFGCDVSDEASVAALARDVLADMGGVDILVLSAGVIAYKMGIGPVTPEEWDRVIAINLRGTYLVCRELIEPMKQRGGGRIITFSSLAARVGGIEAGIHYSASKAALIGFTRTLAKEGGPYGITVNAIAPGVILTDPVRQQIGGHEDSYTPGIPLRRLGQPRDVANVVLFLASELSSYVTGLVVDINGGQFMG